MNKTVLYKDLAMGGLFQNGRKSAVDEGHFGSPTSALTADVLQLVNVVVSEDRRITVTHTADKSDMSCGSECVAHGGTENILRR
jgi:hypothetical protein